MILDVPEGAQYGRRTTALMEAFPGDDETLIWVGEGADRIAVYAHEMDLLANDDFEKQAREFLARYNTTGDIFEVKVQSPDVVYALRKTAPERITGADAFGVAVIRHKDGSMIFLRIVFAENHAKTPEKSREWAEKVIRSVRFGDGKRNVAARKDIISFFNDLFFEVPVPEGYVRTVNPAYDFIVTRYTKLSKMEEPTASFALYLGGHPSFHEDKFKGAQKVEGAVAGKKVTWFCFEPEPGVYAAESCVCVAGKEARSGGMLQRLGIVVRRDGDDSEPPVYMHLMITMPSAEAREAQIKQLSQIKETEKPTK